MANSRVTNFGHPVSPAAITVPNRTANLAQTGNTMLTDTMLTDTVLAVRRGEEISSRF